MRLKATEILGNAFYSFWIIQGLSIRMVSWAYFLTYCGDSVNLRPFFSSSFKKLSNFPFGVALSKFSTSMIPASRHLWANTYGDMYELAQNLRNVSIHIQYSLLDLRHTFPKLMYAVMSYGLYSCFAIDHSSVLDCKMVRPVKCSIRAVKPLVVLSTTNLQVIKTNKIFSINKLISN